MRQRIEHPDQVRIGFPVGRIQSLQLHPVGHCHLRCVGGHLLRQGRGDFPELLKRRQRSGKLRVLAEPFIRQNRDNPDETLASFARRRVGQEFLDYAVNPFLGGVYACSPEDLCTRHALPRLWRLEQNHGSLVRGTIALMRAKRKSGTHTKTRLVSFADGLERLPRALAASISKAIDPS